MFSASFARAEAAWMEPPEPVYGVCKCGRSEEDHDGIGGDCEQCETCDQYDELTPSEARWDAESEAGDVARKERGIDD